MAGIARKKQEKGDMETSREDERFEQLVALLKEFNQSISKEFGDMREEFKQGVKKILRELKNNGERQEDKLDDARRKVESDTKEMNIALKKDIEGLDGKAVGIRGGLKVMEEITKGERVVTGKIDEVVSAAVVKKESSVMLDHIGERQNDGNNTYLAKMNKNRRKCKAYSIRNLYPYIHRASKEFTMSKTKKDQEVLKRDDHTSRFNVAQNKLLLNILVTDDINGAKT